MVGQHLGTYQVLAKLGEGGMGEVYRAYDQTLQREVALKIIPPAFSSSAERLTRFKREARLLAALNHPNVGAIYGFEEAADTRVLVLELVEGETLAERLARSDDRRLPLGTALEIARQIAAALDAAHDRGIIHRDLKPANVKIAPSGVVKVLDFGLGKSLAPESGDPAAADETATIGETGHGLVLGTPAYMSPEQARGLPVDKRSDVWAFGCVLYEMLAGSRPFAGEDVADTLSRVLRSEPDLDALPAGTPGAIRRLIARCLEKDPHKRLPQMAVAAFQIDEALAALSSGTGGAPFTVATRPAVGVLAATLVGGVALGAASLWLLQPAADVQAPAVTRLQLSVAPADEIGGATAGRPNRTAIALSPDGRTLVFTAVQKGQRALFARPLDKPAATVMPGTDGGVSPFFSPDGRWVGYWSPGVGKGGGIRKAPLDGGPSIPVLETPQIAGATWTDDDRIIFARGAGGLIEVAAAGGAASELTSLNLERGEVSHRLPHALPGGDAVLYTATRSRFPQWDEAQVWVWSRRTGSAKLLIDGGADARWVESGHLLYVREGALLAVPFDRTRLEVTGGPVGIVSDVMQAAYIAGLPNDSGAMQASVSRTGTLVYITGGTQVPTEYAVLQLDRAGQGEPLPIPAHDYRTLSVAPDGSTLALSSVGRDRSIWLYSFARGTFGRLTPAGRSLAPIWTRDGQRITYGGGTSGDTLHSTRADGGGQPELLFESPLNLLPAAWGPGDRQLLYYSIPSEIGEGGGAPTFWVQERGSAGEPRPIVRAVPTGGGIDISPDGRWLAFHSSESGEMEVYVEAFPGPGPRIQVSTTGGGSPVWRADGREMFYARSNRPNQPRGAGGADVDIMAVTITPGDPPAFGAPRRLFSGRYSMNNPQRGYDVRPDGQRFYMLQPRPRPADVVNTLNVVLHWSQELRGQN